LLDAHTEEAFTTMQFSKLSVVSTFTLLAVACGGKTSDGGPLSLGVPPEQNLGALSPDQTTTICKNLVDYYHRNTDLLNDVCQLGAVLGTSVTPSFGGAPDDATLRSACNDSQRQCLQTFDAPDAAMGCNVPKSCNATLGEWEDCFNELKAGLGNVVDELPTCNELTSSRPPPTSSATELLDSSSCKKFMQDCPEGFGLSSGTTSSDSSGSGTAPQTVDGGFAGP
jgi:hypothetical protein